MSPVDPAVGRAGGGVAARRIGPFVARRDLFDLLRRAGRVTSVSAPAGSGKTSLLRSWIAADLRFSLDESQALFEAAGVRVSASTLARLADRTEGWAAGRRLAA